MSGDRVFVLGFKGYDFKNEDGKQMKGQSIHYIDSSFREDSELQQGIFPIKTPCTSKVMDDLKTLPAFYEVDFRQRPDGKGKPILTAVGAEYLESIEL